MKDAGGKLLITDEEVRKEAMKHYKNVFDYKPMDTVSAKGHNSVAK